jgi:hypothetical protein
MDQRNIFQPVYTVTFVDTGRLWICFTKLHVVMLVGDGGIAVTRKGFKFSHHEGW